MHVNHAKNIVQLVKQIVQLNVKLVFKAILKMINHAFKYVLQGNINTYQIIHANHVHQIVLHVNPLMNL